jgi:hypothetical protein
MIISEIYLLMPIIMVLIIFIISFIVSSFIHVPVIFAEVIDYHGGPLPTDSLGDSNSLFSAIDLSGNNVSAYANVDQAFGGISVITTVGHVAVENNTLNIKPGVEVAYKATGGYSVLTISSEINTNVLDTNNNTVNITQAEVYRSTIGGFSKLQCMTMAPGCGGISRTNNNTVNVTGSTLRSFPKQANPVIGGSVDIQCIGTAESSHNTVNFIDSNSNSYIVGANISVMGGSDVITVNNTVNVIRSHIDGYYKSVYGATLLVNGNGTVSASNNNVNIVASTVSDSVNGSTSFTKGNGTATLNDNVVIITSGSALEVSVCGGDAYIRGSGSVQIERNSVTIIDSTVGGDVIGGEATVDGRVIEGEATVDGDVVGGKATVDKGFISISVINNTVTLQGNTNLYGCYEGDYGKLTGGITESSGSIVDVFTGNTLNIVLPAPGGIKVGLGFIDNFEYYNFMYAANSPNDAIAIKSMGLNKVVLSDGISKPAIIASIDIAEGGPLPAVDQRFVLINGHIQTDDGSGTEIFRQTTATGKMGRYVDLEFDLDYTSNGYGLVAIFRKATSSAESKSLPE